MRLRKTDALWGTKIEILAAPICLPKDGFYKDITLSQSNNLTNLINTIILVIASYRVIKKNEK